MESLPCQCGCGQEAKPGNRFIRGHNTRGQKVSEETRRKLSELQRLRIRHGHCRKGNLSPTYRSWGAMWERCRRPKHPKYHLYGGRGITVCERWRLFANFLADMGERPEGRSLDRIDNDGNYEPGNCRWATPLEQNRNRQFGRKRAVIRIA